MGRDSCKAARIVGRRGSGPESLAGFQQPCNRVQAPLLRAAASTCRIPSPAPSCGQMQQCTRCSPVPQLVLLAQLVLVRHLLLHLLVRQPIARARLLRITTWTQAAMLLELPRGSAGGRPCGTNKEHQPANHPRGPSWPAGCHTSMPSTSFLRIPASRNRARHTSPVLHAPHLDFVQSLPLHLGIVQARGGDDGALQRAGPHCGRRAKEGVEQVRCEKVHNSGPGACRAGLRGLHCRQHPPTLHSGCSTPGQPLALAQLMLAPATG